MSRRAVLDVLASEPSLSHLVSFSALMLAPEPALETGGKVWGKTSEGLVQGDTPSGDLFAIGLQPDLVELDRACRHGGGQSISGHDDIFALGPADVVIPAVQRFARAIFDRCHLQLQWDKPSIFSWNGELPAGNPAGVKVAGEVMDGSFECGIDCYGVPVGSYKFINKDLMGRAWEIVNDAEKATQLLSCNRQALWTALRLSILPRFKYVC